MQWAIDNTTDNWCIYMCVCWVTSCSCVVAKENLNKLTKWWEKKAVKRLILKLCWDEYALCHPHTPFCHSHYHSRTCTHTQSQANTHTHTNTRCWPLYLLSLLLIQQNHLPGISLSSPPLKQTSRLTPTRPRPAHCHPNPPTPPQAPWWD